MGEVSRNQKSYKGSNYTSPNLGRTMSNPKIVKMGPKTPVEKQRPQTSRCIPMRQTPVYMLDVPKYSPRDTISDLLDDEHDIIN